MSQRPQGRRWRPTGKTIIFARNHDHAVFIEERFNFHYPHLAGHFARVIDNKAKYPQSLIDDFSQKDKAPHIAISVDMLGTGIDVPEIVFLVFFKPVYSKIKFWQMIGRGTPLCKNLVGPDQDEQNFRIFDFCFNFDFFRENPNGIEGSGGEALGTRHFKSRAQLLAAVQKTPALEASGTLRATLTSTLHGARPSPACGEIQESECMDLAALEELRIRMRGLVQFIDKSKRKIVYTDFEDEITGVREDEAIYMPKMTGNQYAKKVEEYLRSHLDEIAIQRPRSNQPLTPTNLQSLEQTLLTIGEDEGERLLTGMLQRHEVPTLAHLVRRIAGMDRSAAKAAFAISLEDRSLSAQQMRFVELVIDQLTGRGGIEPSTLYEQPFSSLHANGPEGLFAGKPNIIDGLFYKLEETLPRVMEG